MANGIIININDSERIVQGDICIFRKPWVLESLKESGFGCSLYVTDCVMGENINTVYAPHFQLSQDDADLMSHRFLEDKLYIEDVLFVTAVKIGKIIAERKRKRQRVYLLGFDFDADTGYSKKIGVDYSRDESEYKASVISAQEHYLLILLYLLRESNVLLVHVGEKPYSKMTYDEFSGNMTIKRSQKQQGRKDGLRVSMVSTTGSVDRAHVPQHNNKKEERGVLIIAEITTNHFGDLDRLKKMVWMAKEAGADYVKVQKRDVNSFYTKEQLQSPYKSPFGKTFGDYRHGLELDDEGCVCLLETAQEADIGWIVSVLDYPSFEFVIQYDPEMIKVPSTISQHREFIKKLATVYRGKIVVSMGFTDSSYEDFILDTFMENRTLYMLQCTSAYPAPFEECNIGVVRHYHDLSKVYPTLIPGYSSHDIGSICSMLAVAAGARMIEKHVKIGSAEWAHFDQVAVDMQTGEFGQFVKDIRQAEIMLGSDQKTVRDCEHHKYWSRSNFIK